MASTPLSGADVPHVLHCLQGALSQNVDIQKQAEAALSALELRTGFCSCLAEIIGNREHEHSARWLASVHLKNSISRNWRVKLDQSNISNEEKAHLRAKLSQLISQDDNQIAVQIAVIYARIARFDYPREWPSLFQDLMTNLVSAPGGAPPSLLTVRRVYLILHHVLKELSSKRLPVDQRNFAAVTQLLFSHVWGQWCSDTQALLSGLPACLEPSASMQAAQPLLLSFERWLLLLKILRRLILFGYPNDFKSLQPVDAVMNCVPPMVEALRQLMALRPRERRPRSQLQAMLDRGLLKLMKTQCQLQEAHPWSYHASAMLLPLLGFCCDELMAVTDRSLAFERLLIQCMIFIKNVIKCEPYRGKTAGGAMASSHEQDAPVKRLASEVQASLTGFWAGDRLPRLCTALVSSFFVLTARDLEDWESSPEEFYHAGDSNAWQDHIRLCAEALYLELLTANRGQLAPVVLHMLQQMPWTAGSDLAAMPGDRVEGVPRTILYKEAVYGAVAVGAYELHDYVDFTPWLRSTLLQELAHGGPLSKPLRRAVLRIISEWVARVEVDDRPAVYRGVLQVLAEDDLCMQMSAVNTLRVLVDDWNFQDTQFVEFVAPVMKLLMQVLANSSELDTQTQTFNLMNTIIERMGDNIRPYVEAILQLLPGLWRDAEGQSLVRIQILTALQRLVNVLGPESPVCYSLVLPMLQYSIDLNQPEAFNLVEDGLGLWLVALRNAPCPQPALLGLFPALVSIMASSTEHIAAGMAVITSCVLMGGADFMQAWQQPLSSIFTGFIGNVNERGMLLLFPVMDLIITASPAAGAAALQPALLKLLGQVLGGKESSLVVAQAMTVFGRLLLQNQPAFTALFSPQATQALAGLTLQRKENTPATFGPGDLMLAQLLEQWTDSLDALAKPRLRKLCGLALCQALTLPHPAVLMNLDAILACISGVWHELEGGADAGGDAVNAYEFDFGAGGDDSGFDIDLTSATLSEDAEGECNRRKQLQEVDPVGSTSLRAFLNDALNRATAAHGPALQAALNALDRTLADQVKAALGMADQALA